MKLEYLAVAALAGTIFAQPALAQDMDWSGFYAGIIGGVGVGTVQDKGNPSAAPQSLSGYFGGVEAGFNIQTDTGLVFGVEADWSAADIGKKWFGYETNIYDAYYGADSIGSIGTLRGRIGFASGQFLPFVTAGLAIGGTNHMLGCDPDLVGVTSSCGADVTDPDDRGDWWEDSNSGISIGWVVGGGAEVALTDSITLKGEVLYGDLGTKTVTLTDPKYPLLSDRLFATTFTVARVGVNFNF